jgi:hypothetical protein
MDEAGCLSGQRLAGVKLYIPVDSTVVYLYYTENVRAYSSSMSGPHGAYYYSQLLHTTVTNVE